MIEISDQDVYLACGPTDMRKSINGLVEAIASVFKLDPFANALFVFCNRRRDIIKIIEWDTDGFWLYMKRLEKGRYLWPEQVGDDASVMTLTHVQLAQFIQQTKLTSKIRRNPVSERDIH
jgi:transposase